MSSPTRTQPFSLPVGLSGAAVTGTTLLLLGGAYYGTSWAIQQLQAVAGHHHPEVAYLLAGGMVAVTFTPLRQRLCNLVARYGREARHDHRAVLDEFLAAARSTIRPEELIQSLHQLLEASLQPSHVSLYLKQGGVMVLHATTDDAAAVPAMLPQQGATTRLMPTDMMAVTLPLTVRVKGGDRDLDEVVGVLAIGPKRSERDYSHEDRQLLADMARELTRSLQHAQQTSEAVEKEAFKRTLEQARLIQRSMLPDAELPLMAHQVVGYSESADETGGDYYDWSRLEDGRFAIAVGDVTGHGIDAALIVAMAKACLFNQLKVDPSPSRILAALNETIHAVDARRQSSQTRKLMTLVYALLDEATGTMTLASAGHFYPLVYRAASDSVDDLAHLTSTLPLGVRPPAKFKPPQGEITLAPGDVCLFFTDGVHEARDPAGHEYGLDRLQATLARLSSKSAAQIQGAILGDLYRHIGKPRPVDDDVTLLVLKAKTTKCPPGASPVGV